MLLQLIINVIYLTFFIIYFFNVTDYKSFEFNYIINLFYYNNKQIGSRIYQVL